MSRKTKGMKHPLDKWKAYQPKPRPYRPSKAEVEAAYQVYCSRHYDVLTRTSVGVTTINDLKWMRRALIAANNARKP